MTRGENQRGPCNAAGQSVDQSNVQLQRDQTVLTDSDIIDRTRAPKHAMVTEHRGVLARDIIRIQLRAVESPGHPPLLCGIELVEEP